MLATLPLPGVPKSERERRKVWTQVPQRIRAAIRRLHKQFGHCPRSVLIALIKASKLPKEYLDAARSLKCNTCDTVKKLPQTTKVSLPKEYIFNHTIGIDVFDLHDANGKVLEKGKLKVIKKRYAAHTKAHKNYTYNQNKPGKH